MLSRLVCFLAALVVTSGMAIAEVRLVMVEEPGCMWCARWNAEIAPIYPKTGEGQAAPLMRIELSDLPENLNFQRKLHFTPTFVLMRDNSEISRLEGYPGEDFFWGLLGQMLKTANVPFDING